MTLGAVVVLALGIGAWLTWWFFLTPAPPPPPFRRRLEGVGLAVRGLAACTDGVRLTVRTDSGDLVCEFCKRQDAGGFEQDVFMIVPTATLDMPIIESVHARLADASLGSVLRVSTPDAAADTSDVQVALFGRPEDLGFRAIAALRTVAAAIGLPVDAVYVFQRHGHLDPRLEFRFRAELQSNPDASEKARELRALWEGAAA